MASFLFFNQYNLRLYLPSIDAFVATCHAIVICDTVVICVCVCFYNKLIVLDSSFYILCNYSHHMNISFFKVDIGGEYICFLDTLLPKPCDDFQIYYFRKLVIFVNSFLAQA